MNSTWALALTGGALIGVASALLLIAQGRVAGISGVVGSLFSRVPNDRAWRLAFLGGMLAVGLVAGTLDPEVIGASPRSLPAVIVAGVLVGYGTRLGGGCTSGHGVCGVSRFAARSIIAVVTFMTTGAVTVWLAGGGS